MPLYRVAEQIEVEPVVRFIGTAAEEDKVALYRQARAFLYPTRYEGFGLPVLEAMACGTPAICSNTSSLPEVAGEAALLAPPDDARAWVEAIARVMDDDALRAQMRERGLAQAARFSWDQAARQTAEVYRAIVDQNLGR